MTGIIEDDKEGLSDDSVSEDTPKAAKKIIEPKIIKSKQSSFARQYGYDQEKEGKNTPSFIDKKNNEFE